MVLLKSISIAVIAIAALSKRVYYVQCLITCSSFHGCVAVDGKSCRRPAFGASACHAVRKFALDPGVISYSIKKPVTKIAQASKASPHWSQFVPKLWENARGVDVRLTWDPTRQSSQKIAMEFLGKLQEGQQGIVASHRLELESELAEWIDCFVEYCRNSLTASSWNAVSARIVASRGPASTKCPRWHKDHVPFRWIHSLVGPGCEWVDPSSINPIMLAELDDDMGSDDDGIDYFESTAPANARPIIDSRIINSKKTIHRAYPGEAVLLLGNQWGNTAAAPEGNRSLPAVIHKSPDGIPIWQGRILFTMDVMCQTADVRGEM